MKAKYPEKTELTDIWSAVEEVHESSVTKLEREKVLLGQVS